MTAVDIDQETKNRNFLLLLMFFSPFNSLTLPELLWDFLVNHTRQQVS
jgi:hypothetical protein